MKLFIALAFRNVFRNRVRTVVALFAIASGCAAMVLNTGVMFNIFRELREDAIHGRHGHLQIYARGYSARHLEDPERYRMPAQIAARAIALARANPAVLSAVRRLEFSGLASFGDRSAPFLGVAVEPEDEQDFSRRSLLRAGESLFSGRERSVLLGLGLSKRLGGRPADEITLMTMTGYGALNAIQVQVRGIFEGGMKEYDDWTLRMPLASAEALLMDNRVEEIVLLLARTEDVPRVSGELTYAFQREGLDLEIRSWKDLALFHNQVVGLFGRALDAIRAVVCTIVLLGIANAIGMSIVERRRELATIRALGIHPRAVGGLLMMEGVILGLIGAAVGALLGIAIARAITAIGIPYPSPPGATRPFRGGVDLVPAELAAAMAISLAATMAAAIFPVWRALRRAIAPALRGA
jgi:putative ABC transport system permease protein